MADTKLVFKAFVDSLPTIADDLGDAPSGQYHVRIVFHGMIGFVVTEEGMTAYMLNSHTGCIAVPKQFESIGRPYQEHSDFFDLLQLERECALVVEVQSEFTYSKVVHHDKIKPKDKCEEESLFWLVDFNPFVAQPTLKAHSERTATSLGTLSISVGKMKTFSLEGRDNGAQNPPHQYCVWTKNGSQVDNPARAIARSVAVEFTHSGDLKIERNSKINLLIQQPSQDVVIHVISYSSGCEKGVRVEHFKQFSDMYQNPGNVKELTRSPEDDEQFLCLNEACPPAALFIE